MSQARETQTKKLQEQDDTRFSILPLPLGLLQVIRAIYTGVTNLTSFRLFENAHGFFLKGLGAGKPQKADVVNFRLQLYWEVSQVVRAILVTTLLTGFWRVKGIPAHHFLTIYILGVGLSNLFAVTSTIGLDPLRLCLVAGSAFAQIALLRAYKNCRDSMGLLYLSSYLFSACLGRNEVSKLPTLLRYIQLLVLPTLGFFRIFTGDFTHLPTHHALAYSHRNGVLRLVYGFVKDVTLNFWQVCQFSNTVLLCSIYAFSAPLLYDYLVERGSTKSELASINRSKSLEDACGLIAGSLLAAALFFRDSDFVTHIKCVSDAFYHAGFTRPFFYMFTTVFVAPICIAVVNTSCDKFYRDKYTRHVSVLHLDTFRLRNRHAKLLPWVWALLHLRGSRFLLRYPPCTSKTCITPLHIFKMSCLPLVNVLNQNMGFLALNGLYYTFLIGVELLQLLTDYYSYRVFKSNVK